jgi:hypothetical protein
LFEDIYLNNSKDVSKNNTKIPAGIILVAEIFGKTGRSNLNFLRLKTAKTINISISMAKNRGENLLTEIFHKKNKTDENPTPTPDPIQIFRNMPFISFIKIFAANIPLKIGIKRKNNDLNISIAFLQ